MNQETTTRQSDIMQRKKDWMNKPRGNNKRASDEGIPITEEMTGIAQRRQDPIEEEDDPSPLPLKNTIELPVVTIERTLPGAVRVPGIQTQDGESALLQEMSSSDRPESMEFFDTVLPGVRVQGSSSQMQNNNNQTVSIRDQTTEEVHFVPEAELVDVTRVDLENQVAELSKVVMALQTPNVVHIVDQSQSSSRNTAIFCNIQMSVCQVLASVAVVLAAIISLVLVFSIKFSAASGKEENGSLPLINNTSSSSSSSAAPSPSVISSSLPPIPSLSTNSTSVPTIARTFVPTTRVASTLVPSVAPTFAPTLIPTLVTTEAAPMLVTTFNPTLVATTIVPTPMVMAPIPTTTTTVLSNYIFYNLDDLTKAVDNYVINSTGIPPMATWDISRVTSLDSLFSGQRNADLKFFNAADDLSTWSTENVVIMESVFTDASAFNGNISTWNVSKVKNMKYMFDSASSFNQNLSWWDTSNVLDMMYMFYAATAFNGDISTWDISKVTSLESMLEEASSFNQDLSKWNPISAKDLSSAFREASSFNNDISNWDVSKVKTMKNMFNGAASFNQNLCSWGSKLPNDTILNNFVVDSSCPNLADPSMSRIPPGPFCHLCT